MAIRWHFQGRQSFDFSSSIYSCYFGGRDFVIKTFNSATRWRLNTRIALFKDFWFNMAIQQVSVLPYIYSISAYCAVMLMKWYKCFTFLWKFYFCNIVISFYSEHFSHPDGICFQPLPKQVMKCVTRYSFVSSKCSPRMRILCRPVLNVSWQQFSRNELSFIICLAVPSL